MSTEIKEAKTTSEAEKQRWEEETLKKVLAKRPERKEKFEGISLEPVERLYTEAESDGLEVGFPANILINERHSPDRLSRQTLDNAPVCRLFFARRNQ